jgi:uncharacterized repeat protein (TIGR03803 family)
MDEASRYRRDALVCCIALAALAGCGGAPGTMPLSHANPSHRDAGVSYKVLYTFKGGTDGAQPASDLLDVDGKLYGTTFYGGDASNSRYCYYGCGTVFETTTAGAVRILHRFVSYPKDGADPAAGLIALDGDLYGTTTNGGANGTGTVYAMSTAGKEKLVYSFGPYADGDGQYAASDLLAFKGVLYGTTEHGGRYTCYSVATCGTVFKVTTSGKETVLYSFRYDRSEGDGFWPHAGIVAMNGLLYGTAVQGGDSGAGTIYTITPAGKEAVLYGFSGGHDGAFPFGRLTLLNGEFYGTTASSGAYGHGAIFAINASGKEHVVYAFKGSPADGSGPDGDLTVVDGKLYGTTSQGGKYHCASGDYGCGTVFAVTTSGTESFLHSFKGGEDGANPNGSMAYVNGSLYGTTYSGGTGSCNPSSGHTEGCGTIFEITP